MHHVMGLSFLADATFWETCMQWLKGQMTWWNAFGLLGNVAFFSRFMVQWIASERAGKSIIPVPFWTLSIVGSIILLIYSIHINKLPLILGYAPNTIVYVRNLMLIEKEKKARLAGPA